jgi:hypothetical protein
MFCTLGASGRLIQVPDDAPFVCPLCGKVLVSPALRPRNRMRTATLFSLGVGLAVFAAFVGGMVLGVRLFPLAPPTVQWIATIRVPPPLAMERVVPIPSPPALLWAPKWHRNRFRGGSTALVPNGNPQ